MTGGGDDDGVVHVVSVGRVEYNGRSGVWVVQASCECGWRGVPRTEKRKAQPDAVAHLHAVRADVQTPVDDVQTG